MDVSFSYLECGGLNEGSSVHSSDLSHRIETHKIKLSPKLTELIGMDCCDYNIEDKSTEDKN